MMEIELENQFKADEEEKLLRWLKIRLGSEDVELHVTFVK